MGEMNTAAVSSSEILLIMVSISVIGVIGLSSYYILNLPIGVSL